MVIVDCDTGKTSSLNSRGMGFFSRYREALNREIDASHAKSWNFEWPIRG